MLRATGASERIAPAVAGGANRRAIRTVNLPIRPEKIAVGRERRGEAERLSTKTDRHQEQRTRLLLAFVGSEEKQLVLDDRAAQRPAVLLIGKRQHSLWNGIGRIERIVAEIAIRRAVIPIRTSLGLGVDLQLRRTP